jgi:MFS family permease
MGSLAVILFLRAHHVDYGRVGSVAALYGICSAIGGPVLGRIVDKRGQLVTLLIGAIGSGCGFALLALFGGSLFSMTILGVAMAGFLMPPLEPALRSLWPSVLSDASTVEVAYALDSALQNVLFVAGPLLVVLLVGITSTVAALLSIGTVGVLGALVFVAFPPVRVWRAEARARDLAGPLRSRLLVVLLISMLCLGGVVGVFNVVSVAYSEKLGHLGYSGLLLGAFSFGSLIGGLAYGARNWVGDPLRRLAALLLTMAVCVWPLVVVTDPTVMAAAMVVAGLGLAPVLTCCFVLIGRIVPQGTVTEAFAWVTSMFLAGSAAGSAVAGAVLSHSTISVAFGTAGMAATIAFLIVLVATYLATTRPRAEVASTVAE